MKRGHNTGEKRERAGATDWYARIEAEHIARIEAEEAYVAPAGAFTPLWEVAQQQPQFRAKHARR